MTEIASMLDGIVHRETQEHSDGFDLTVSEVYEVEEPGRVDFGGGELESAGLEPHEKHRRRADDDYMWWELGEGQYVVEYNESLDANEPLLLQTRREVLERGAFHPLLHVESLPLVPLSVAGSLLLKENARVSTLRR